MKKLSDITQDDSMLEVLIRLPNKKGDLISKLYRVISPRKADVIYKSLLRDLYYYPYRNPFHSISICKIIHFLEDPPFM